MPVLAAADLTTPQTTSPVASRRLCVVFPSFCDGRGLSHVVLAMLDAYLRSGERRRFRPEYWTTSARKKCYRDYQRRVLPHALARLLYRLRSEPGIIRSHLARKLIRSVQPGDVVHLFPGFPRWAHDELRARGAVLVFECVNTALHAFRRTLLDAYGKLGYPPYDVPSLAAVEDERARIEQCDFLFTPSPLVEASFREVGVPAEKMLSTSYGYEPAHFRVPVHRPRRERPTFLFAAAGSVRKGLPDLLRTFHAARTGARLIVVGDLDPTVASRCAAWLTSPDVELRPYTRDLGAVYAEADAFVLPSYEEGSPIVSYFGLAAGLPCLLTPAAAGWVVRHDVEGLIAEPGNDAQWIEHFRAIVDDAGLRARLGRAALERSREYTWDVVASRRYAALDARLTQQKR